MRRLLHTTIAAAACGVALLAGTTGPAYAATGSFYVALVDGTISELVDPADGTCHVLATADNSIADSANQTDAVASIYATADCTGEPVVVVAAGAEAEDLPAAAQLQSVVFAAAG